VIKSVSALSPLNERWLSDACVRAALGSPPRQKSIQVFRNPILDRWLGRTHPALPALLFGPLIVVALVYARGHVAGQDFAGAFLGGVLGFTLLEYLLHRFVLHRPVGPERASRIAAFLRHGNHHAYPSDEGRLVLPPLVTIPFAVAIAVPAVLLSADWRGRRGVCRNRRGLRSVRLGALVAPPRSPQVARWPLSQALPSVTPPPAKRRSLWGVDTALRLALWNLRFDTAAAHDPKSRNIPSLSARAASAEISSLRRVSSIGSRRHRSG